MGVASNVISGFGVLRTAPSGTAIPSLATLPITWTGFTDIGYTMDGVQMIYTPTVKDINVDEEMSPVDQLLTAEKLEFKAKLAESTIENLALSVMGSTLTNPGTGRKTLDIGSQIHSSLKEFVLAFQGPAIGGSTDRIIVAYRAKVTSAITLHYQRTANVEYDVTFNCLADSTKAVGARLCQIIDFNAGS